jgi:hypothetical protein
MKFLIIASLVFVSLAGLGAEAIANGYGYAAPIVQQQRIIQRQSIVQRQRIINRPIIQRQRIVQQQVYAAPIVAQQVYAAPLVAKVRVKQYVVQPYVAVPQLQYQLQQYHAFGATQQSSCFQGSCQLQQLNQYTPTLPQCQ